MGNVKLLFCGVENSSTETHTLEIYKNIWNEIFIKIDDCNKHCYIVLDKQTAIKLSREIRKQIALLEG